ncbi:hypothetical protein LTR66_002485 [Elasticomyces elasticus]|nr:hypothetical protein LTR66_002485 [Elasticomyces elasticus]
MSSPRAGLRFLHTFRQSAIHRSFLQRRGVQTAAETAIPTAEQGAVARLWNSPVGPKTVHFWAPIMKWGVVLAGISDFARPASSLSLTQNAALICTGAIWTRWCFVIKPRNIFLASVNFLLFCVGATQVGRVLQYQASLNGDTVGDELKKETKKLGDIAEGMVKDPKHALEKIENPRAA